MAVVGTICWECHSGLGHLARDFYRNGVIQRVMPMRHPHYPRTKEKWYKPEDCYYPLSLNLFLDGLDALLLFETAVGNSWKMVEAAHRQGVKIILMPMYEYTPYPPPVKPDLVLCPSALDVEYYCDYNYRQVTVPVDKPWRLRVIARDFVHNAGHGQVDYAKGTPLLIEAMNHVKAPITLTIRGQPSDHKIFSLFKKHRSNPRLKIESGDLPEERLFEFGDVFINAEQLNGLSLPLQEAYASGMLVMTPNRYPTNTWLPTEPLIPVAGYRDYQIATKFQRAIVDPQAIAATIDAWYEQDIEKYSRAGKKWAEKNSWEVLRGEYLDYIEEVVNP